MPSPSQRLSTGVVQRPWLWALGAACLAAAVYVNTLHNPFVFDDRTEILENASIRDLTQMRAVLLHSVARPVANLSYALDYAVWGLDPFGYHLTNLLLHVANVLLLFVLVHGIARNGRLPASTAVVPAFAAAALFGVHPLMTEAVVYVSSRSELLSGALMLGSLLLFRRGLPDLAPGWLAGGAALFVLALGAKEIAAMLPFALLAYDAWLGPRPERFRARLWRVHLPLVALVASVAAVRVWLYVAVEHAASPGPQWESWLVSLHVAARYVGLLLIPVSQSVVPAVAPIQSVGDMRVLTAVAALALVAGTAAAMRRRNPTVTFGVVWFALLLVPSGALILLADRGQPMAEHRVYVASFGFFTAVAALSGRALSRSSAAAASRGVAAALGAVLLVLGGLTMARNNVWADPVHLWEDAARKAPTTYASHFGVAEAYREIGDCPAAIGSYRRAIALSPTIEGAYLGLAACESIGGNDDNARLVLRAAVERAAETLRARVALAALEEQRGNRAEALRLCREAAAERPGDSQAASCVTRNQTTR